MPDYGQLATAAKHVLAANRMAGTSDWEGMTYDYVCPSPSAYPFQWLWDSAFHAIALLHLNPELAKQELRCLLQAQQRDGFVPHVLLWNRAQHEPQLEGYALLLASDHCSAITQPPVVARALERVFEATRDRALLEDCLPAVLRLFRWLGNRRDPDHDGLLSIIQPDESGMDASPKFDHLLGLTSSTGPRPETFREAMDRILTVHQPLRSTPSRLMSAAAFQTEEVLFNVIYGDGLRCLARLCDAAGTFSRADIAQLESAADGVTSALMAKCWDPSCGLFWDLAGKDEEPVRILTISSIFPLVLRDLEPRVAHQLVRQHLLNPAEFWTRYPLPSVAIDEPQFDPAFRSQCIWRGPTWVNTNWYLYWALKDHGFGQVASALAERTFDMVTRGGMREFFNPLTAEGCGAQSFGWTALVLDLLAAEGVLR